MNDFSGAALKIKAMLVAFLKLLEDAVLQGDRSNDFCKGHNSLTLEFASGTHCLLSCEKMLLGRKALWT
jgi:hypothetical protein